MTPRRHEQSHCQDEERVQRTLHSNLQYITAGTRSGRLQATSDSEEQRSGCFDIAATTLQMHIWARGRWKIYGKYRYDKHLQMVPSIQVYTRYYLAIMPL